MINILLSFLHNNFNKKIDLLLKFSPFQPKGLGFDHFLKSFWSFRDEMDEKKPLYNFFKLDAFGRKGIFL
jgi:hypothetical protein